MSEENKSLNDWIKLKSLPNPLRKAWRELMEYQILIHEDLVQFQKDHPNMNIKFEKTYKKMIQLNEASRMIMEGSFLLDVYREEHASLLWQLNEAKKRLGIPKDQKITNSKTHRK